MDTEYTIVNGPEGLAKELEDLAEKSQKDPAFAREPHYLLYQLGDQKSLLKVDMKKMPYQFWYYDLLGRPMTNIVKEILVRFMWEKCDKKDLFFKEMEGK